MPAVAVFKLTQTSLVINYGTAVAVVVTNSDFIFRRLWHCGTAVAVVQLTNCIILFGHCGTAGAGDLCRSKWAVHSAIDPDFILLTEIKK